MTIQLTELQQRALQRAENDLNARRIALEAVRATGTYAEVERAHNQLNAAKRRLDSIKATILDSLLSSD